jgi:hypothetical protein
MPPLFAAEVLFMSVGPAHQSATFASRTFAAALLAISAAVATATVAASAPPVFLTPVVYGTGGLDMIFPELGGPVWTTAADVNGDGRPDLLMANWCVSVTACTTANVGVLLNVGDGSFRPAVAYDSGGHHALTVSVADMNGDGVPDLVVANGCALVPQPSSGCPDGSAGVLLGNGDGTFRSARTFSSGGSLSALVVADVNHDGRPDVVVSNCSGAGQFCPIGEGSVGILINNGDGTLQPVQLYDSGGLGADSVSVTDVNSDGQPDVLVSNLSSCQSNCLGTLGVLLARGDGTFQPVQVYDAGTSVPRSIATADFNGDQKTDVVLVGGGQLSVLLNRGDGTFQPAVLYDNGGTPTDTLVIGDLNSDGKLDLVVRNGNFCTGQPLNEGCVGVLLGRGDGSFQPVVTYGTGATAAESIAGADFNGDGKLDVAVAHQCSPTICGTPTAIVGVLEGNGDGTFQPPVTFTTRAPSVLVLATDLNGDGRPDLVVGAAPPVPAGSISVMLNGTVPEDDVPPVITIAATPNVLWPPNGAAVPVTISGTIIDTGSGVSVGSGIFTVKDEYGEIQPSGAVAIASGGTYAFTIPLRAARAGSDKDGRLYAVTVSARDNAGNVGSASAVVTVPHDQRW